MSETKLHTDQLGSNELVWTEGNLQAGTNVTISKQPTTIVDDDTLVLLHYENEAVNYGKLTSLESGSFSSSIDGYYTDYKQFGNYGARISSTASYPRNMFSSSYMSAMTEQTIDFWMCVNLNQYSTYRSEIYFGSYSGGGTSCPSIYFTATTFGFFAGGGSGLGDVALTPLVSNEWHHIAFEMKNGSLSSDKGLWLYVDGELVWSNIGAIFYAYPQYAALSVKNYTAYKGGYVASGLYIDELRISKTLRYNGQSFTPPEHAYAGSTGSDSFQINAEIPVDTTLNAGSKNPVQNKVVTAALNTKLDTTTAASTYATQTTVAGKVDAQATQTVTSTTPSLELAANTVYTCTDVDSLTITSVPVSNLETIVYFTTSASFTSVTLPANQAVIGDLPTWEASKSYVMSFQNGILVAAEVNTL